MSRWLALVVSSAIASGRRLDDEGAVHPVLLDLGPLKIQSYGATLVVAFLLSSVVALLAGRRLGASMETTLAIYFAAVFAFPVGAIVGGALVRDGPIDVFRMSFQLASGVLVATAGAVAAAVGLKRPAGSALDAVAIAALAGLALGRLGCFLGGCCSGRPTDLPWAVRFPLSTTVIPAELRGLDVHPTQLYLLVILLGAAVVLHGLAPRLAPGRAAPVGLAVLALSGLAISPLRAEPESGLAVAAWVTLLVFALGAAVRRSTNRAVG